MWLSSLRTSDLQRSVCTHILPTSLTHHTPHTHCELLLHEHKNWFTSHPEWTRCQQDLPFAQVQQFCELKLSVRHACRYTPLKVLFLFIVVDKLLRGVIFQLTLCTDTITCTVHTVSYSLHTATMATKLLNQSWVYQSHRALIIETLNSFLAEDKYMYIINVCILKPNAHVSQTFTDLSKCYKTLTHSSYQN